ncbi:hypothetical protein DCAR_0623527 [Daucus carota subsp. sativus]|uniref:Uncharacterized protein n=1 Tax=Daucus carota subsp. sativus TaxID=79200 RepID=A0A161YBP8_DAUCS|nr:PREDICTED: uncharacterized protein LOC108225146 [Daucus carota subsp. sativus]WOH04119.1 hypothetical protein DCAR_0623527 [Daucus carota subsp. sativus]
MKARVIVFPIRGRNWCFSRSVETTSSAIPASTRQQPQSHIPSTLKELWNRIYSAPGKKFTPSNAELVIDFASNKMNNAWIALETAPAGSLKNKIHGVGLKLLSRVKPSEILLKSITKDVTKVEIMYPLSLNARLVRRRLRHIALRGTIIHKKYFYGSLSLLPLTTVFTVLPLPNIPFFWILFRTYSHWRALQGSTKLLQLVSDSGNHMSSSATTSTEELTTNKKDHGSLHPQWVLLPSKELEEQISRENVNEGLSKCSVSKICKSYNLNIIDVMKYEKSLY